MLLLRDAQLSYRSPNGQSMVRLLLLCPNGVSSKIYRLQWMSQLILVQNILLTLPTALLQTSRSRFSYSRYNLFQLRSCCPKVKLDHSLIHRLKSLGIYRARGCRAGVNSRFKSRQQHHKILVRVTDRSY